MELNALDEVIRDSIEAINTGTAENPNYCGWLMGMRTRKAIVLARVKNAYPALLQYIDNHREVDLPNGNVNHIIDFYIYNPKPKDDDGFVTSKIHNLLSDVIWQFYRNLQGHYRCEFVGQRQRLIEQFPDLEAGIAFTMQIETDRLCSTLLT